MGTRGILPSVPGLVPRANHADTGSLDIVGRSIVLPLLLYSH
jgi:hypothetical protein